MKKRLTILSIFLIMMILFMGNCYARAGGGSGSGSSGGSGGSSSGGGTTHYYYHDHNHGYGGGTSLTPQNSILLTATLAGTFLVARCLYRRYKAIGMHYQVKKQLKVLDDQDEFWNESRIKKEVKEAYYAIQKAWTLQDVKTLKEYFLRGQKTKECFDDFGKDVIPAMLNDGVEMYAYPFRGYWRDVGTIDSLWEANMDLIKTPEAIDLSDQNWKIYTNTMDLPPQYIGKYASVKESLVADGCSVLGSVENTVLSHKVEVGEGSTIRNSVIMPNVKIGKNVVIEKAMIAEGAIIKDNAVIKDDNNEISVISEYEVVEGEREKVEA